MSCEKNQNQTTHAAEQSGGIPSLVSKNAHFTGKIFLAGLLAGGVGAGVVGGIQGIKWMMEKAKEARSNEAAQKAEVARKLVALVKDSERTQAALDLQIRYLGKGINLEGIHQVVGLVDKPNSPNNEYGDRRLSGNMRVATGELGTVVYERLGHGLCLIRGIQPHLHTSVTMRNRLAAYSCDVVESKDSEPVTGDGGGSVTPLIKTLNEAGQWVGEHNEEITAVVGTIVRSTSLVVGGHRTAATVLGRLNRGNPGTSPLQNVLLLSAPSRGRFSLPNLGTIPNKSYLLTVGLVGATETFIKLQEIRDIKAEARRLVAQINQPERIEAAKALPRNYDNAVVSREKLESLMGAKARLISENTWQIQDRRGNIIFFDNIGDDSACIQAIIPTIGQETSLQKGLESIVLKRPSVHIESA